MPVLMKRPNILMPVVFVAGILLLFPIRAQNALRQEYQVKGAFLFQFSQFTHWPDHAFASPSSPFVVGILGHDPFGRFIDDLVAGEQVEGHPIVVKRYASLSELEASHILFISKQLNEPLPKVLEKAATMGALTVSEITGFAQQGGMVRFYVDNNKIKFQVNVEAAKSAGLTVSSKLLRLAQICCNGNN